MHCNSLKMQKVREIGWEEAGESRAFSTLWKRIIKENLQKERLKI